MGAKLKFVEPEPEVDLVRLDLGCGKGANTKDGFEKIDLVPFKGVRVVDLRGKWPWKANSVDEVFSSYLLNYLTMAERVHFANELYRVLKPGARAEIHTPHWCAARAYADPLAVYPPVSEGWYGWLNKAVRDAQNSVDRSGLTCDFEIGMGYGMHPALHARNLEYQQHALQFDKEAAQDLIVTLTKV